MPQRALATRTDRAQVFEAVDARFVAVGPAWLQGVATDQVQVNELLFGGGQSGSRCQHTGPTHLAPAVSARAGPSQLLEGKDTLMPIGPGHLNDSLGALQDDGNRFDCVGGG